MINLLLLMEQIPYFVVITKPTKHKIQTKSLTDSGKDLDDIRNKIVYIIQEEVSKFIDIPESYDDFIYKCWYSENSADAEPFDYKIYNEGKWISPWTSEELYDSVYEILHKMELLAAYIDEANKDEEEVDDDNNMPAEME